MGDGAFVRSPIAPALELQPTSGSHGVIQPEKPMPVGDYQAHLAATREDWHDEH
jgi:hypothetical protein